MFNFANQALVRTFVGAVGTLFFAGLCLAGSAGPAVAQIAVLAA